MQSPPHNILVVRNDKLGDFVLSLPTFALLKRNLPATRIGALVPAYTRELAANSPWIDNVLVDTDQSANLKSFYRLTRTLRKNNFDAFIALFSTLRIAAAGYYAGIPYRLGPATKIAQIMYNARLRQRRSRSEKPEWQYNLDLGLRFLRDIGVPDPVLPEPPYLFPSPQALTHEAFLAELGIEQAEQLIVVHPGSGGSANNLSLEQYARLMENLAAPGRVFVISAGPGELDAAKTLGQRISELPHRVYYSDRGLMAYIDRLALADLFIAGSTGSLHLAGALDVNTAAFYPRRRSATSLRWQTLNSEGRRLSFSPHADGDESDMRHVDLDDAATQIARRFLQASAD